MRVVDAFMFSEPHEADLLWVKLNVEDRVVDRWVVVENSYSFQGALKGHHLRQILATDARFARFRDRLEVIECELPPSDETPDAQTLDGAALAMESRQRERAWPYLQANFDDTDYVLISDVDECLDLQSDRRRRLLLRKLGTGDDIILVPRIRYWFDYDNRGLGRRCVPLVLMRRLRAEPGLADHRARTTWKPVVWRHEMVFEYSYCFPRDKIMRKFDTFGHTGFEKAEVDAALDHNHRPTSHRRDRVLDWNHENWFVTRRLTPRNSPSFVRENLTTLKTNAVPRTYPANRRRDFPEFFPPGRVPRVWRWIRLYKGMYAEQVAQGTVARSPLVRPVRALAKGLRGRLVPQAPARELSEGANEGE